MRRTLFVLLMLVPSLAFGEPFSKMDYAFQGVSIALDVMDWGQTLDIERLPHRYYETNNILGRHPSRSNINYFFISKIIFNATVARALPNPYRRIWQCLSIGVSGYYVEHNYHIGLRIRF